MQAQFRRKIDADRVAALRAELAQAQREEAEEQARQQRERDANAALKREEAAAVRIQAQVRALAETLYIRAIPDLPWWRNSACHSSVVRLFRARVCTSVRGMSICVHTSDGLRACVCCRHGENWRRRRSHR